MVMSIHGCSWVHIKFACNENAHAGHGAVFQKGSSFHGIAGNR